MFSWTIWTISWK